MPEILTVPALNQTWEQREQRIAMDAMTRTHKCAECRARLEVITLDGYLILVCGFNRYHLGYLRYRTNTQKLQAGEPVSIDIVNRIRRRKGAIPMTSQALTTMTEDQMLERISSGVRFVGKEPPQDQIRSLALVAIAYGLDPIMNEVTIYEGKPYVTVDGRYRKAIETRQMNGSPIVRPATRQEREDWEIPDGDLFYHAEFYKKGEDRPYVGWGRVHGAEMKVTPTAEGRERSFKQLTPLMKDPRRMCEKRATVQALRTGFHIPLPTLDMSGSPMGDDDLMPVIEGTARDVTDDPPALVPSITTGGFSEDPEPQPPVREQTPAARLQVACQAAGYTAGVMEFLRKQAPDALRPNGTIETAVLTHERVHLLIASLRGQPQAAAETEADGSAHVPEAVRGDVI